MTSGPSRRVFVVSAPSGTGKTTLNRRLIREYPELVEMSVSYTARGKRQGEVDGVDYHFVSDEQFREQIKRGEMLEYAEVFGTLYGTSLEEVKRIQDRGRTCLLEIDVQGWKQAHAKLPTAKSVFILPPTIESLHSRLAARGTESPAVRWRRLKTARDEIAEGPVYDDFVVNADVDAAYLELQAIIIQGKSGSLTAGQGRAYCERLLAEFDEAPWIRKLSAQFADKT